MNSILWPWELTQVEALQGREQETDFSQVEAVMSVENYWEMN